ncbi:MAG TPA: hypothetical protein VM901_03290 [Bdellovibrionota bacterium]|nr:hypothetical protein [Bdellovibrionota bacterium]
MRIWTFFWFFALTVAHAQDKATPQPRQGPEVARIETMLDATALGLDSGFSNIADYFWGARVPNFLQFRLRENPYGRAPTPLTEPKPLNVSQEIMNSLRSRGYRTRDEFYDRVVKEVAASHTIDKRTADALDDLKRRLAIHAFSAERLLNQPRSETQIDSEATNRFQSTYQRPRSDSVFPLDRFNFGRIRNRVAYEEDGGTSIDWKNLQPQSLEAVQTMAANEISRLISETAMSAIQDFLPLGLEFNAASRAVYETALRRSHDNPGVAADMQVELDRTFGFEDKQRNFHTLEEISAGELKLNDRGDFEFRSKGKDQVILFSQYPLVMRRFEHIDRDKGNELRSKLQTRDLSDDTIQLWLAKEQAKDPQWILRPPEDLAKRILNKHLEHHTFRVLWNLRINVKHEERAGMIPLQLQNWSNDLRRGIERYPGSMDPQENPNYYRRVNFQTLTERIASHPPMRSLLDLDKHLESLPSFRLRDIDGSSEIENHRAYYAHEHRLLLWSRLVDQGDDVIPWLTLDNRSRLKRRPTFLSAMSASDRIQNARLFYHRALARTKKYSPKVAATVAAIALLWGGGKAALPHLKNLGEGSRFTDAENVENFYESLDEKLKTANEHTFGEPKVIESEWSSAWRKVQELLPAVQTRSSPPQSYTPSGDRDFKVEGSGLSEDPGHQQVYELSGRDAGLRTLLYEANPQELREANITTLNPNAGADLVLKGTSVQYPTDGYLALHTPKNARLSRLELRTPSGALIPRNTYETLQDPNTGAYGVKFNSVPKGAVVPNLAYDMDSDIRYNIAPKNYGPLIDAPRMREISAQLREAGFTAIADDIDITLRRQAIFTADDVAEAVRAGSVYTHARAPDLVMDEAALARNPFLKISNYLMGGIACGECDMAHVLVDGILRQAFRENPDIRTVLRSSLVAEDGKVDDVGHVETELHFQVARPRNRLVRVDGTPTTLPLPQLEHDLAERDRLASGKKSTADSAEGTRHPAESPTSEKPADPEDTPKHVVANPAAPFQDRRRRDPLNLYPDMDYVPFDLRPQPLVEPTSTLDVAGAASPTEATVKKPPKEATPTTPSQVAEEKKAKSESPAPKAVVKKPAPPTPEELWQRRWRERLEKELGAQEKLLAQRKLRLDQTPLLRPIAAITSHLWSYSKGHIDFTELYRRVTGKEDSPNAEVAAQAILESLQTQQKAIDLSLSQMPRNPKLASRAPELAEKEVLESFTIRTPNLLREMMRDRPAEMDHCVGLVQQAGS